MFFQHPLVYQLQISVMMDATNAPQIHAPNVSTQQTPYLPCFMQVPAFQLVQLVHIKVMWEHVPIATPPVPFAQQHLI